MNYRLFCPKCHKPVNPALKGDCFICPQCWSDLHMAVLIGKVRSSYNSLKYFAMPTGRDIFEKWWLDGLAQWKVSTMNAVLILASMVFIGSMVFMSFAFAGYVVNSIAFGF